jgi:hypothetical protein
VVPSTEQALNVPDLAERKRWLQPSKAGPVIVQDLVESSWMRG